MYYIYNHYRADFWELRAKGCVWGERSGRGELWTGRNSPKSALQSWLLRISHCGDKKMRVEMTLSSSDSDFSRRDAHLQTLLFLDEHLVTRFSWVSCRRNFRLSRRDSPLQRTQRLRETSVAVCCSVLQCVRGLRDSEKGTQRLRETSVLQCVAMCCSVLEDWETQRKWLRDSETRVCCSVLQCVAVCCSVLEDWETQRKWLRDSEKRVCCSVLQCVAVCCSVLEDWETQRKWLRDSEKRACCSVLQCVAVC